MDRPISNAERISENHLPGMARMVALQIVVEGTLIRHFKHFTLNQSTGRHHHFVLILASDALETVQDARLKDARKFLGKRITLTFSYKDAERQSPERSFVGTVTQVVFSQEQSSLGDIILEGYSPTILLDAAPHCQSFGGEKPVNTAFIARSILSQGLVSSKYDCRIDTQYKGYIPYSAQYNETHYNYLARISAAYGELFYYDGETLHFGKLPRHESPLKLVYGSSIRQMETGIHTVYTRTSYFGYNPATHTRMRGIDASVKHQGEPSSRSYELNAGIYGTESLTPAPLNPNVEMDVDDAQKTARGHTAVEVFTVSGQTTIPFLYPGCIADLETRRPDTRQTGYFTRVMITEISHQLDALGNYSGNFRAIAEGTGYLPEPEYRIPSATPQIATVISNQDPLGQGRIRVRFDWQTAETTHFIRMMSPDAGASEAVPRNRGFVAIPETGDQVMVGFEYSHPDFPFAMGAMFHGKNAQGGGIGNHLRSLQTRSGIKILMNDLEKSITIKDPSGNTCFMDGQGNLRLTAPGNIELTAGGDITLSAGKNMEAKTGNSMEFDAGNLASFRMMSAALFSAPEMELSVPARFSLQSGKTSLLSEEETVIQGKTARLAGMEKLMIHSEQETTVNSKGKTHVLGRDGNNHSNIPRDYNPLEKKMDGRCLVHFRPQADWNGRGYGFDWIRAKDTEMPGDIPFFSIISARGYGGNLRHAPENYMKLVRTYSHYIYPHIDSNGFESRAPYVVPYMTLYPSATATLDVLVNNREAPISIELEYDTSKFQITHPPLPLAIGNHTVVLTVTCLREFRTDRMIKATATYPGRFKNHRKDAGAIKVKANHTRYVLPVVFINVTTDIGSGRRSTIFSQQPHKDRTTELLRQAYITPEFLETLTLDLSSDDGTMPDAVPNGKTEFNRLFNIIRKEAYQRGTSHFPADHVIQETRPDENRQALVQLRNMLDRKLQLVYPEINLSGTKKVFFISQFCYTWDDQILGGSAPLPGRTHPAYDIALIFKGGSLETIAHEIMHSLGLEHTFSLNSKFIFEKGKTDNVMDYPEPTIRAISTFHWQWKIMQENTAPVRRIR